MRPDLKPLPPPKPAKKEGDKDSVADKDTPKKDDEIPMPASTFHSAHGTVFLVHAKSQQVVWSTYQKPGSHDSKEMQRTATRIAKLLEKDLAPPVAAGTAKESGGLMSFGGEEKAPGLAISFVLFGLIAAGGFRKPYSKMPTWRCWCCTLSGCWGDRWPGYRTGSWAAAKLFFEDGGAGSPTTNRRHAETSHFIIDFNLPFNLSSVPSGGFCS